MNKWLTRPTSSTMRMHLDELSKADQEARLSEHRAYEAQERERLRAFLPELSKLCEQHGFIIGQAEIASVPYGTTVNYSTFDDHWRYLSCNAVKPERMMSPTSTVDGRF